MIRLNSIIYNKLLLQAEEAKEQGMTKLAASILEAIGSHPKDEAVEYTYNKLQEDIHRDMWKLATRLMYYYDVESADVEKIDGVILSWASKMIDELEPVINTNSITVGPLEPKVPGENK